MATPNLEPDSVLKDARNTGGTRERIFTALKTGILTGALEPGYQLRLRDIAQKHGASMMPVREAIVALEAIGLVKQIPYRGAFVSHLTSEKLRDFYQARLVVEPGAVEMSASLLTRQDFRQLRLLLGEIDANSVRGNWHLVIELDEEFLMTIYRAAGSSSLVEMIRTLWNRVAPYKHHLVTAEPEAGHEIVRYNRRLLTALEARDAKDAMQILRDSLRGAMQQLSAALPTSELPPI